MKEQPDSKQNTREKVNILTRAYRWYEDVEVAAWDEFGERWHTRLRIRVREYTVVEHTPKGFWIYDPFEGRRRFVLGAAKKKFAHLDLEAALDSFIERKRRQIDINESGAEVARTAKAQAEDLKRTWHE
jgi:hypothetical protein